MRCACIILLCRAAGANADPSMRPLDSTLVPAGITDLPTLHVAFNRSGLPPFVLDGNRVEPIINEDSPFLKLAPIVHWPGHSENAMYTLAFVDLGPEERPGKFFPFIHSLWTQCRRTLMDCEHTVKPYLAPGNVAVIPNRYTFILFRRAGKHANNRTLVLNGVRYKTGREKIPKLPGFSFARMLRENVGLEAVRYNFIFVRGKGGSSGRRTRRGMRTKRGRE
jgi:hypothetical protein